jgi:hypothetical protein
MNKIWQTTIWLKESDPVTLYGETQAELRTAVAAWLAQWQPTRFSNAPDDYLVQRRIMHYFYSDGWLEMNVDLYGRREILTKGWYYKTAWMLYEPPHYLGPQSAMITHFVEKGLLIEPGPDHQEDIENAGHPALNKYMPLALWGFVGMVAAVCYLSVPIDGGMQPNPIIAQRNIALIILFIGFVGALFVGLGPFLTKGYFRFVELWRGERRF